MLLLSVVGHINLRNIFNWLLEASETMYIEPKKASGHLFPHKMHSYGTEWVQMSPGQSYFVDAVSFRPYQP